MGKPKTNVAMGRQLLRTIYAIMRDGTLYEHGKPNRLTILLLSLNPVVIRAVILEIHSTNILNVTIAESCGIAVLL